VSSKSDVTEQINNTDRLSGNRKIIARETDARSFFNSPTYMYVGSIDTFLSATLSAFRREFSIFSRSAVLSPTIAEQTYRSCPLFRTCGPRSYSVINDCIVYALRRRRRTIYEIYDDWPFRTTLRQRGKRRGQ